MADLLTNAQREQFYTEFENLADTFFKTEVKYLIGYDSLGEFYEDKEDKAFYEIALMVLKEDVFTTKTDLPKIYTNEGILDNPLIQITLNMRKCKALNLLDSHFKLKFDIGKDYFIVQGDLYKVRDINYDGALTEEDVLAQIVGEKFDNSSLVLDTNVTVITDGSVI